jgi:hypothetical protein
LQKDTSGLFETIFKIHTDTDSGWSNPSPDAYEYAQECGYVRGIQEAAGQGL